MVTVEGYAFWYPLSFVLGATRTNKSERKKGFKSPQEEEPASIVAFKIKADGFSNDYLT